MTDTPGNTSPGSTHGRRVADEESDNSGFGGTVGWTLAGTIIPGLGLWRAGHRIASGIIMGAVFVGLGGLIGYSALNRKSVEALVLDPTVLYGIAAAFLLIALGWVSVITITHLALRPARITTVQRVLGAALVGILSFAIAAPLAMGANIAYTSASAVSTIFGGNDADQPTVDATDPWKGTDRLNVLILGGDSGVKSHRSLAVGARTDTVIVASIDTHTGATTLITLPRNATKMPFPTSSPLHKYYPNGFTDTTNILNAEYLLNAMYRNVPAHVPNTLLGKTKDFGASVVMQSVGYALGLDINYYAFVNMDGFKDFINAIGGITVNVNYRIPVGGHNASGAEPAEAPSDWIEVGANKHLSGGYALWYARGRYKLNDYSRMERQRCVINAVVKQTDPATVLTNYQSIAQTGEKNITTNIPRSLLPALVDLGLKTKNTKLRSLVFDPTNGFYSWKPNWNKVRAQVKKALAETDAVNTATATATPSVTSSATSTTGTSTSPSSTATSKSKSDDLDDACAYHPHKYTGK